MTNVSVQQPNRPAITIGTPINDIVNQNPPIGIQYQSVETFAFADVSYFTGDDAWRKANGEYNTFRVENPLYTQQLDTEAVEPFTTLRYNNVFGNKNRFTDFEGQQNYPRILIPNYPSQFDDAFALIIDHLVGFGFIMFQNKTYISGGYQETFVDANLTGRALSAHGFSEFGVCSYFELMHLAKPVGEQIYSYEPILMDFSSIVLSSSTVYLTTNNRSVDTVPRRMNQYLATTMNQDIRLYFWSKNLQQTLQP